VLVHGVKCARAGLYAALPGCKTPCLQGRSNTLRPLLKPV